jgi:hypothetical protein
MKLVFSILFSILVFSGCVSSNTPTKTETKAKVKSEKQILIDKANNGDIKAMIELNRFYLFPQTKEGLELYTKWYPLILQNKNLGDILEFIPIFEKYQAMFINGKDKVNSLKEYAIKLGSQKTLYELIPNYYREKNFKKIDVLLKKAISLDDQNALITLRNSYLFNRIVNKANDIQKHITKTDNEYFDSLSLKDKIYYLHMIYIQRREKGKEYDRIIKESINSNDLTLISAIGKFLSKNGRSYKAKDYLEKAIKLGTKDKTIYLNIAQEYDSLYSYKDKYKSKIYENFKKASLLDSYEATKTLLEKYKENKNSKEYLELIPKLAKLHKSKRAYADFLYTQDRINEAFILYDQLAQKKDVDDMIKIAQYPKGYSFNPQLEQLIDKQREYILKDKKPYLRAKLKKELIYEENKELKQKIIEIELDEQNIQTLKELAKKKFAYAKIPYLKKASSYGDMESKYLLADEVGYDKDRLKILQELEKTGDKRAYKALAKVYEKLYEPKKVVYYYEKAYENGDKSVIDNIIVYYICEECKMLNDEKVEYYVNEAIKDKDSQFLLRLANSYKLGKVVKKDIKKALKYFKLSYSIDKNYKASKEIKKLQQ